MFDFIPLSSYTPIYYHSLFLIMLIVFLLSMTYNIDDFQTVSMTNFLGYVLLILSVLYMGLRPLSEMYFDDMATYAKNYRLLELGFTPKVKSDYLFTKFMLFCSKTMNVKIFFLLVDIIYILPCYLFSRKYGKSYWFFIFFMFLCSFSFWAYGTNGLRNGMATSLFVLGLYFYERKTLMYGIFFLAFGFHNSLMIPLAAFFISGLYKNPKYYLYIWLACIPLSLVAGSSLSGILGGLTSDDRAASYLSGQKAGAIDQPKIGFRWDFIFYSSFAVIAGWYYIFKKKVDDKFYIHLYGVYMIANAFWILLIRANFSNRFAYLSWFLMAPVIAIPLFKYRLFNDQYKIAGLIIAAYFMFTYIMFLKT